MTAHQDVRVIGDTLQIGDVTVAFERTLRIPESGLHPLPPSLGRFPVRRVADYPATAPQEWLEQGGVMLPMYQREAMWLSFSARLPAALQVGVGRVCAISGEPWAEHLTRDPQNYVVLPQQPWLDGVRTADGEVSQFVAVPLGLGATLEAQVTGAEQHGSVQLRAVPLSAEARARTRVATHPRPAGLLLASAVGSALTGPPPVAAGAPSLGLGAGGRMRQQVFVDSRPLDEYDDGAGVGVVVHLCSASQWCAVTAEVPTPTPVDREAYVAAGLPWFDFYDADAADLPATAALAGIAPVGKILGEPADPFAPVAPASIVQLKDAAGDVVADAHP